MIDPTLSEEELDSEDVDVSSLTIGYQPSLEQIVQTFQEGNVAPKTLISDIQTLVRLFFHLFTILSFAMKRPSSVGDEHSNSS